MVNNFRRGPAYRGAPRGPRWPLRTSSDPPLRRPAWWRWKGSGHQHAKPLRGTEVFTLSGQENCVTVPRFSVLVNHDRAER